jgi:hypothetical protein
MHCRTIPSNLDGGESGVSEKSGRCFVTRQRAVQEISLLLPSRRSESAASSVNLLTSVDRDPDYRREQWTWMRKMESRFDMVTIASAVCVAGYVAIALGYVSIYDLGLSREQVRDGAMIVAILVAALVAIDFFGKRLRKAK